MKWKLGLWMGMSALLASAAIAQDNFDRTVASIALLQIEGVRKDLKVTQAQRERMNKHAEAFNKEGKAYQEQLQKAGKNAKRDEKKEVAMLGKLKNSVLGELTAAQTKRLREITLQSLGVGALGDNTVAKRVGLNNDQVTKIRKLLSDGLATAGKIQQATVAEARKGIKEPKTEAEAKKANETIRQRMQKLGPPADQRIAKVRQDTEAKVIALMTTAQRATWRSLLGATFKS